MDTAGSYLNGMEVSVDLPGFLRRPATANTPKPPAAGGGYTDEGFTIKELQDRWDKLYKRPGGVRDAYQLPGKRSPEQLLAETLSAIQMG